MYRRAMPWYTRIYIQSRRMKASYMYVNIQSRIKKVRVKARCIDFWQQFPSIIMNIRAFILHISIFCDKIFWLVSRKMNTSCSNIFLNSVNGSTNTLFINSICYLWNRQSTFIRVMKTKQLNSLFIECKHTYSGFDLDTESFFLRRTSMMFIYALK